MNDYKHIDVVKHGPLFRAKGYLRTSPGSPYRSMFVHDAIVVAYGWSAEQAAKRCREKKERLRGYDAEWATKRKKRTRTFAG